VIDVIDNGIGLQTRKRRPLLETLRTNARQGHGTRSAIAAAFGKKMAAQDREQR